MALTAGFFKKPQGLIEPRSMFPGETEPEVNTRLETYIVEGELRTADLASNVQDLAVSAWVYYRAFLAVFIELSGNPSSTAMADQGSTLYTAYQINNFKDLSDKFLKDFEGYLTSEVPISTPRSYSVSHTIAYR